MTERLIILGAGPAGYTAAIYAARAGLSPLLIEGAEPGGQLALTTDVDNFPGFSRGIQGPELMNAMREQVLRFDGRIINGVVSQVELKKGRPFKITADNKLHLCEALIVATGASTRWLGLPSETALRGKGVSSCATCDGFFFKGQDVAVVGGGDTAVEEAIYLANIVRSVTVIHRRDELRASKELQKKAKANSKISFIWNAVVSEIRDVSAGKVTSVVLKDVKNNQVRELPCNGVFVAVGHEPNTAIFKGQLKLDKKGYVVTRSDSQQTSVGGVFAAGDVCDPIYRQAVTAAGAGCMAAIDAEKFLGV